MRSRAGTQKGSKAQRRGTIGKRLLRLLQERDMKPIDLTRKAGFPRSTVYNWTNNVSDPNSKDQETICKALGIERSELFRDKPSEDVVMLGEKRIDLTDTHLLTDADLELAKKFLETLIQARRSREAPGQQEPHAERPRVRILLAEDDKDECFPLAEHLEGRGYEVIICPDGASAYLKLKEGKFDVILLDLKMGNMGGRQFLRLIRQEGNKTPVIVVTGYAEEITEVELEKLKISGWLKKPVKLEDVVQAIKDALDAKAT